MKSTNGEVISTLNDLIETCRDAQKGFQTAAEGVNSPTLRSLFEEYALQRAEFAGELQGVVTQLGGDPEKTGSISGAIHRGWMNIKSAVTGKDEHYILEECERSEDSSYKNYEEALKKSLPPLVRSLVQRQYNAIREAHDRIRNLRDRVRTAGI
ncbi:MAG: PA2169 family four-helix-bundle protein [Acidobacteria bacterium]|nr:PA2169 family four-helix-bundle protein [Acidobacteriota bacterium]